MAVTITSTHYAYPRRDGQAEFKLAWVAWLHTETVYPRTVTHLSTNPARRRVTSLISPTMLPLSQTATIWWEGSEEMGWKREGEGKGKGEGEKGGKGSTIWEKRSPVIKWLVMGLYNFKASVGSTLTQLFLSTCREAGVITWIQFFERPPLKFGRAKNLQNSARLLTTFDFISGTGQYIQNRKEMWSRAIPPAFREKSPVTYGPQTN